LGERPLPYQLGPPPMIVLPGLLMLAVEHQGRCLGLLPLLSVLLSANVTACTVQGMACVGSGQAPAWPLVSGRRGTPGHSAGHPRDLNL
jgi:hypothetical protein